MIGSHVIPVPLFFCCVHSSAGSKDGCFSTALRKNLKDVFAKKASGACGSILLLGLFLFVAVPLPGTGV